MSSESDGAGRRYLAPYEGTVADNADPLRLGRVRVRIPGVCEPASAWALPFGGAGAGSKQRGFYDPPDVGADVLVFFIAGDVDRPRYTPGHWGAPGGAAETPGSAADEGSPGEAVKIKAYETDRYKVEFDHRVGKTRMVFLDKTSGDMIEFDGVARAITIKATTSINIQALGAIDIKGTAVTINGRLVAPTGTPIE
jgi:uncharacterized protein involved in type VI secretion and phage assembly